MGLFIVSHLLLMTLLFQPTEENAEWKPSTAPEPDTQSVFREFCLRTPDDSRWTSSASVTQLPTKSAHPTKHATQTPQQPSTEPNPPFGESTQEPEADIQGSGDIILEFKAPRRLGAQAIVGCRCRDKEKKHPSETEFTKIMMLFPTETCESAEFIGTLMDGTEVCVITPSLSAFYKELFNHRSAPATEPSIYEELSVTSPAPLDPTTELPTTTQPSVTETNQVHGPNPQTVFPSTVEDTQTETDFLSEGSGEEEDADYDCESCHFTMSLDNIDPMAVQSLSVTMQSLPCPILIHVSLNGDSGFCLDSHQPEFKAILKKLEIPPTHEDYIARTPKNIINGCRCKEREQKRFDETSTLTSTKVWLPSATCSSTEFIETLIDGREVCVTAPSLLAYLEFLLLQRSKLTGDTGGHEALEIPPLVHGMIPNIDIVIEETLQVYPPALVIEEPLMEVICIACSFRFSNLNPKDVQSLEMVVTPSKCPVFIHVHLKSGARLCLDSSQPWFNTALEELEIQEH